MESQSPNAHVYNHNIYEKNITYQWYQSRWFGVTDRITITKKGVTDVTDRITITKGVTHTSKGKYTI